MADNIIAPATNKIFATDEIANVHYPRTKIGCGPDGEYADVDDDNPLPVFDTAVVAALQALAQAIGSGSGGGTIGGATETTLAAVLAKMIAAPATSAKQDAIKASVDALLPSVDGLEGLLAAISSTLAGTLAVSAQALPLPAGAATQATLASLLAKMIAAPATEAKQDTTIALLAKRGIGNLTLVPAGTTNGTLIGNKPAAARGIHIILPPGTSVTLTITDTAPTTAPAAKFTVSATDTGPNWDEDLADPVNVYVTAITGAPLFRYL